VQQVELDDVNQAYLDLRSGISIRGVIDFVPVGTDLG
jgi:Zn-dependent alcohol dehydrogenase